MSHEEENQPTRTDKEPEKRTEPAGHTAERAPEAEPDTKSGKVKKVKVNDVELKTVEIRLNGVKEATHRSRFVFLVMTIVTSAILITLWNSTFSWNVGHATRERGRAEQPWSRESRIVHNQDELISEWIKNRTISVGLLGIRVGVSDLAFIGSASLIVIMTWYFFSQRRENRAIVSLLRDCAEGLRDKRLTRELCSMVYQGVVHSLVFIDLKKGDVPLKGLASKVDEGKSTRVIRYVLRGLVYLPPFTILMIFASDIYSLYIPSAFRHERNTLIEILRRPGSETAIIKVGFFLSWSVVAAIYTGFLCHLSRRFSLATEATLRQFEAVTERPDEYVKDPDGFLARLEETGKKAFAS